jgi:hypothetical protein
MVFLGGWRSEWSARRVGEPLGAGFFSCVFFSGEKLLLMSYVWAGC